MTIKKNVYVTIKSKTRMVDFEDNFLGLIGENLQGYLVFKFEDEFVNGVPRVKVEKDGEKYVIDEVVKDEDTYKMLIKSSLLTTNTIGIQLVITEPQDPNGIPIFKSKKFHLNVAESIETEEEIPEEYDTWIDVANQKIIEVENLNVTGEKVSDGVEITFTDKLGNETVKKVNDGEKGDPGDDYVITPQDYNAIAGVVETDIAPTISAIENTANTAKSIAEGANQALSYSNYSAMITIFNTLDDDVYKVGQNIYIQTTNVPDLWVYSVESTSSTYTYTTDDAFISGLETNGYVQVGYYKLSMLETQEVDLTDYVQNTDYATTQKAGVVKLISDRGLSIDSSNGGIYPETMSYSDYSWHNVNTFVGKGTLENVIEGKGLVNNTDYASSSTAGVIKTDSNNYALSVNSSNGILYVNTKTYSEYLNANNNLAIGKGTLENVITGKGLVKDTDYASSSTGGVVKTDTNYNGVNVGSSGFIFPSSINYTSYQTKENNYFIGKGTLENVITGKGLIKDTDYASSNTAGVVKPYNYLQVSSNGQTYADTVTYESYGNVANQTFISKGTLENVIAGKELLSSSDVKNNVVSTDEDKPLSANMGKELNDRIQNLASIGKYLAMWDCTTGLPTTDPVTMPYTYTTGDYYVISNIGTTNYMPNGSTYTHTASQTQYSGTDELTIGDFFYYDGTVWSMLKNTGKTVYFANIAGSPMDNSNLASALNGKVGFTDYATSANAGVVKTGSNLGILINQNGNPYIDYAQNVDIDAKISYRKPIVPATLDYAVKVGVTTNVNTLTETEKTNACNWLGTSKVVYLTQSEYDDLVNTGTVDSNTEYNIYEEE